MATKPSTSTSSRSTEFLKQSFNVKGGAALEQAVGELREMLQSPGWQRVLQMQRQFNIDQALTGIADDGLPREFYQGSIQGVADFLLVVSSSVVALDVEKREAGNLRRMPHMAAARRGRRPAGDDNDDGDVSV